MAKGNDNVSKQTLYIATGLALFVGFMVGVVFSSFQSDSSTVAQNNRGGVPSQSVVQQGGLTPEQASAILALEQRVAANPADSSAWVELGNTYYDTSNFDKAIKAYTKYDELQPGNANVLTDMGVMYRSKGQPQEAIATFEKAIMADPRHELARFNKGIVQMYDLGDIPGAIASWEGVLQINPAATAANGTPISQIIAEAKARLSGAGQ
jgi:cytochrome c-type biogenesis protein CcmH/NrfG